MEGHALWRLTVRRPCQQAEYGNNCQYVAPHGRSQHQPMTYSVGQHRRGRLLVGDSSELKFR
jgi:hypothetical protein